MGVESRTLLRIAGIVRAYSRVETQFEALSMVLIGSLNRVLALSYQEDVLGDARIKNQFDSRIDYVSRRCVYPRDQILFYFIFFLSLFLIEYYLYRQTGFPHLILSLFA